MVAILSKIIKLNHLHVIGVIKTEDSDFYNVMTVKKDGSKITVADKAVFTNYTELLDYIDKRLPVILVVDGKGVLNKKIDFSVEADVSWYKNIDFGSIYFTSFASKGQSFMSFCRKNIVSEIVLAFSKSNLQLAEVYIGSFLSALLEGEIQNETILSGGLVLEFHEQKLVGFTKRTEQVEVNYTIAQETISSVFLPLYGAVIHFFVQQKKVEKTVNHGLQTDEILYKKAFNVFGGVMIVAFLVSLLSSYLLIQYYGSENAALNLKNVYSNQSYQLILDMEKQKEHKLSILRESGSLSSKFLTYYSYSIIKEVPNDISLTELTISPVLSEIKTNKRLEFMSQTIVIKGETFNEFSFNNWLIDLKKMDWLQDFEIKSIKKDKKNKSVFEVIIKTKNV